MSIPSAARRDAYKDFYPGAEQPKDYRYKDAYYRGCYDEAWQKLQKAADKEAAEEAEYQNREPTLEERVETLEQQVAQLLSERS